MTRTVGTSRVPVRRQGPRLDYSFDTRRLIHETQSVTTSEVFLAHRSVLWGRRLLRTQGTYKSLSADEVSAVSSADPPSGPLGIAPGDAQVGDIVCTVFSSSVLWTTMSPPSLKGNKLTLPNWP